MFPITLILLLFITQPLLHSTTPPTNLTLDEAVEIALINKPDLKAYKYAIEAAKTKGMQALSAYLPQIALNGAIGQTIGDQSPQTTIRLNANQLIYSFAGPIENYKKAKKATNIQELSYDKAKKEIRFYVEQAFLDCWKLQQHNKDIIAMSKSNQSTYDTAKNKQKLKLTDKSDWLASEANYTKDIVSIDNYYQDLEIAQKKLEYFMGQPINLKLTTIEAPTKKSKRQQHVTTLALEWTEPKEEPLLPRSTYYKYARTNKEALKIADKKIGIAQDDMNIQARSNLPTIGFHAYTGYQSVKSTVVSQELLSLGKAAPRNRYGLEAVISWPIFNGLLNGYQEKEAHANKIKEILSKDQLQQEITWEVDRAYSALEVAINNLKAQKAQLIFAKNELTLKRQQYSIGMLAKPDLDIALTTWEKANYAWLEKKIELEKQKRALIYSCGYPKELCT